MFEIICGVSGVLGKGMLIEQVQKILGSEQIDTTLRYAREAEEELSLPNGGKAEKSRAVR